MSQDNENQVDKVDTLNYSTECAALNVSLESQQFSIDETSQLQEQLVKFIELVPNLKQINKEERIKHILNSATQRNDLADANNGLTQSLESTLQNLELNSKGISDLQILQSILDYINDLQEKAYN
jgi:hypothetical protein